MSGIMRNDFAVSPEYGRRLLPVELDRIAKADPGRPFCALPRNLTNLTLGFEDITYNRIANAVNRTAHWLQSELGKSTNFETIAYLAVPDLRNVLLTFAVSKVGFKASSNFSRGIDEALSNTPLAAASFSPQQRSRQCQPVQSDQMQYSGPNRSACILCTRSAVSTPYQNHQHPIIEPAAGGR